MVCDYCLSSTLSNRYIDFFPLRLHFYVRIIVGVIHFYVRIIVANIHFFARISKEMNDFFKDHHRKVFLLNIKIICNFGR
jgi:hypothetical protein